MSAREVLSIVGERSIEFSVVVVLGLIDAIVNALLGLRSGSSRGDDES